MSENRTEMPGAGVLRVRVTMAGGSLPVKGAQVVITEYERDADFPEVGDRPAGEVLFRLTTDEGGLTRPVMLPAPAAGDSLKPGAAQPYSLYNVNVSYDGFYPVEGVGVPVFDRIVAVQPVNLLPLAGGEETGGGRAERNRVMIYETPDSQSLQPGGLRREDVDRRNGTLAGGADGRGVEE